jgi:hypothetical protein
MNRPMGNRPRSEGGVQWAKALILIAVLVVIGVVILARTDTKSPRSPSSSGTTAPHHSSTTPSTVPAPTTTTTLVPASQVKVQVLNGVLTGNLASAWSQKLHTQSGYITETPDNATTKVPTSIIYVITPGYQAEAARLATQVGLPASAVYPTVPPPASAPIPSAAKTTGNLVLVIGPDLAASA